MFLIASGKRDNPPARHCRLQIHISGIHIGIDYRFEAVKKRYAPLIDVKNEMGLGVATRIVSVRNGYEMRV